MISKVIFPCIMDCNFTASTNFHNTIIKWKMENIIIIKAMKRIVGTFITFYVFIYLFFKIRCLIICYGTVKINK